VIFWAIDHRYTRKKFDFIVSHKYSALSQRDGSLSHGKSDGTFLAIQSVFRLPFIEQSPDGGKERWVILCIVFARH
jgi:hypothetical protein